MGERRSAGVGKEVVLCTFGSLGDVHPYVAIALGLQARGHRAVIATSPFYREKIEAEGIGFRPVRPDLPPPEDAREMMRRVMHSRGGPEYVFRHLCLPHVRESYADLLDAVRGADLLVTHPITFAGPVVAEKTGIPWLSSVLAPISFFSAYEPVELPPSRLLSSFYGLGPACARVLLKAMRRYLASWFEPLYRLRAEVGLPPGRHPGFEGQHSPQGVLALFSEAFAPRRPDWPPHTRATGFCFYDRHETAPPAPQLWGEQRPPAPNPGGSSAPPPPTLVVKGGIGASPELLRFLDAGPAPILFALGSSAVLVPGRFYHDSAAAAARLGRRAVLLVGPEAEGTLPERLPEGVAAFDYAPYSEVFPRAAAIVHHGGVGSTAQALRAGRPTLIVPFSHDQPDNAARITRLGVGAALARSRYNARSAVAALRPLLEDPSYAARAGEIGRRVRSEDGVAAACDLIEARLGAGSAGVPSLVAK